jgi:ABC-type multidrug transport system ATPase subunit
MQEQIIINIEKAVNPSAKTVALKGVDLTVNKGTIWLFLVVLVKSVAY